MLSYQHAYHAGNLADVHKHAILCCLLKQLTLKEKPLSYIETHAGRGLYSLQSKESYKTGEAAMGVRKMLDKKLLPSDHPYSVIIAQVQAAHDVHAYPGSPLIASMMLRETDQIHLAELHPQEHAALKENLSAFGVKIHKKDGMKLVQRLMPPTPRRGMMLIDPSYEVKKEYEDMPSFILNTYRNWPDGIIALWYPILADARHEPMLEALEKDAPLKTMRHEIIFQKKASKGHGLRGSGMYIINAPFGIEAKAKKIESFFNY